jgi:hypothetical protein
LDTTIAFAARGCGDAAGMSALAADQLTLPANSGHLIGHGVDVPDAAFKVQPLKRRRRSRVSFSQAIARCLPMPVRERCWLYLCSLIN